MKHGFMDKMWKRKRSLHNGMENIRRNRKGAADQVERESHVDFFFNIEAIVHHEFLRQGQTVNRWCYLEVLNHLRENVRRKNLSCG
jgi:hypothetical protein